MKHYIEELKRQLHEIMERPVTLGRAEEVTVYADAICALRRMDGILPVVMNRSEPPESIAY